MIFIFLVLRLLAPLAALGFFGWLALRYVKSKELNPESKSEHLLLAEVGKLQDVVASLQTDMDALRERQEFTERLLERPRGDA